MAVVGREEKESFYVTHNHREFAQHVVVHAAIPAASTPLLDADSARQRHRHSPLSSPLVFLPRALTLSQQQRSPSSKEAETSSPKGHSEIDMLFVREEYSFKSRAKKAKARRESAITTSQACPPPQLSADTSSEK